MTLPGKTAGIEAGPNREACPKDDSVTKEMMTKVKSFLPLSRPTSASNVSIFFQEWCTAGQVMYICVYNPFSLWFERRIQTASTSIVYGKPEALNRLSTNQGVIKGNKTTMGPLKTSRDIKDGEHRTQHRGRAYPWALFNTWDRRKC